MPVKFGFGGGIVGLIIHWVFGGIGILFAGAAIGLGAVFFAIIGVILGLLSYFGFKKLTNNQGVKNEKN
jgi:uncharacterized membrane protein YhiD involved in acid resistance